jgi:hypothetical protein
VGEVPREMLQVSPCFRGRDFAFLSRLFFPPLVSFFWLRSLYSARGSQGSIMANWMRQGGSPVPPWTPSIPCTPPPPGVEMPEFRLWQLMNSYEANGGSWLEFRLWLDSQLQRYSRPASRAVENGGPPRHQSSASKRACPEDWCLPPRLRLAPATPTRPGPAAPATPLDPQRRNFQATPPATPSAEQPEKLPDRQLARGVCLHCWDAGDGDVGTSTGGHWKVVMLGASLCCKECG